MKNFKLMMSYQGTAYTGWQKAGAGTSIEEALQRSIETLAQHPVYLQATSRTDSGVHAKGQCVNFFSNTILSCDEILYRLNQLLPRDIAIHSVDIAKNSFHPTLDAYQKRYSYQICNRPIQLPFYRHTSWHVYPLDIDLMKRAAQRLKGKRDFSAFCNKRSLWDRTCVCDLKELDIAPLEEGRLCITLCADRFLYKMARNLAGTLAYVGCGKLKLQAIPAILSSQRRALVSMTAPAHGLCLEEVFF